MDIAASNPDPRIRLLDAALQVVRAQGYAGTTVDDVCTAAGVTKGSFFHHFKSKEEMTLAAIAHWNTFTGALFENASYRSRPDPRDRVLGYIDLRRALLDGDAAGFSCFLGTLVQETHATHPRIRDACSAGIALHADAVARDIAAAKALHAPRARWSPQSLALYTQAALQGAFILAKAAGGVDAAAQCLGHLRQHVAHLLGADTRRPAANSTHPKKATP